MGWGSAWGVLWMLLLIGLIVAGAVALARWLLPRMGAMDAGPGRDDDALRVLRARFARGEIDEDEYRARRTILTDDQGGR